MADELPNNNPDRTVDPDEGELTDADLQQIIQVLQSYRAEAEQARQSGPNPRDSTWEANWDRYWGRYNNAEKADWQSKHVMPEVPLMVDRWAAAMREALDGQSEFFTVVDANGETSQLHVHIAKVMKTLLARCSRTPDGHVMNFSSIFEDQMKMGAIMATCAAVTWQEDKQESGWVRVESVDPREVWYDPQGRNLYRKRQYEVDKHELLQMARESDDEDNPLYDMDQIEQLAAQVDEEQRENRRRSTGTGQEQAGNSGRKPIKIEEWLGTIILPDGRVAASDALTIVANDKFIIRGPEENPFWHERDWIVYTPMVSVPLSVYGRSYMEDWVEVADAFIELTNLMLDGVFVSAIKSFVANPELLDEPQDLLEGVAPNKVFTTSEEIDDVRRFIAQIDLGQLPGEAFQIWQALKNELQEGAKLNEISLGQLAPNSRTTATEIQQVQQSGSSMIRSMARSIEDRFLEPILTLIWKTALQHMDFTDIQSQIGEEVALMLNERRSEFADSGIQFRVRGLSGLIDRQTKLQNVLTVLQTVGQNQLLAQQLIQRISPNKLLEQIFSLFGLDMREFEPDEIEQLENQLLAQQGEQAEGQAQPAQEGQQAEGEGRERPRMQFNPATGELTTGGGGG